jgi:anaphase-promoting complex subunit 1
LAEWAVGGLAWLPLAPEQEAAETQRPAGGGAAAELTAWPEFHNGVATGLCLAPSNGADGGLLGRAWVSLVKGDGPSYAHAGLLMALGLRGQLDQLSWTDLYT